MNFRLAHDQVMLFKAVANLWEANDFLAFFSIFELGGIKTKHLMTGPVGNSEFCFPETLNVPLGFAEGSIEGLGETKLAVPCGASH